MLEDATVRANSFSRDVASGDTDVYTAGFPCQPFSSSGNQGGFADERGGPCIKATNKTNKKSLRNVFILENATGLTQGAIAPHTT